jgi:hypothetical protein
MTRNIEEHNCCLELPAINSSNTLKQLITESAQEIWMEWKETQWAPGHFDCIDKELNRSAEVSIPIITREIAEYLCDVHHTHEKTSLVVRFNPDCKHSDRDFFEQVCEFLFKESKASHCLVRSAAFDKAGGYSHQWVGYWKDGQIVTEHTDGFFERFFQEIPLTMTASELITPTAP